MTFEEAYQKAYAGLNREQKKAVDTIEGPVMVIAGPGTGKTHILTLRMANILKTGDVGPSGILALTFTESAARTMRKRLANLIGEATAREVTITTFHGFADMVMGRYPEYFTDMQGKRLAGEAETILIWHEVFERNTFRLLKPVKSQFQSLHAIASLYDTHSREGISPEQYKAWAKAEQEAVIQDETSYSSRGKTKGELKGTAKTRIAGLEKACEAADALEAYQRAKEERGVYDFGDMLGTVVRRLDEEPDLLATLQETYQYILADEHQDANELQHRLMERIMAFYENPNLFVVGDDKQAIYRFQGADPAHFRAFTDLYPQATVITLSHSYRSTQGILDISHGVIKETGEHKELTAFRGASPQAPVSIVPAPDELSEREIVSGMVKDLITSGTPPHEIAVISQRNSTCARFHQALEARGVPTLLAGNMSFSESPLMMYIFALCAAVSDPTNISAQKQALLAPWWNRSLPEYLTFLKRTASRDWSERLREEFPKDAAVFDALTEQARTLEPVAFFSHLLVDSGARQYLLSHKDHLAVVPLTRLFMSTVEELALRNKADTFPEIFEAFQTAEKHNKSVIKSTVTEREGFVSVLTAHKAKGMEFSHVFLVHATQNDWERKSGKTLFKSPVVSTHEVDDARRAFYVALTRAKDRITISYPEQTTDGKEMLPSIFIPPGEVISSIHTTDDIPVAHNTFSGKEVVLRLTREYLTEDGLSPSALDQYLKSPPTFFARYVLRINDVQNHAMVLGTAVHAGLAALIGGSDGDGALRAAMSIIDASRLPRDDAFLHLKEDVARRIHTYLSSHTIPTPAQAEVKLMTTLMVDGVPIQLQGKADCIHDRSTVIDFKTTSTISPKKEEYERQLLFYAYLMSKNGYPLPMARIEQVMEDKVKTIPVAVSEESITSLLSSVTSVVRELLCGEWREGEEVSDYDSLLEVIGE